MDLKRETLDEDEALRAFGWVIHTEGIQTLFMSSGIAQVIW